MSSLRTLDLHQLYQSLSTISIQTALTNPNHLQVLSQEQPPTPSPRDIPLHPQNLSPKISDFESNLAQRSRTFPLPPKNNSTEPLPLPPVFHIEFPRTTTPNPPGQPETGLLPMTPGTPPPGLSDPSPLNPQSENSINEETTEPESLRSSSPTNLVSMTDFLNVINAANEVTIHRIVEITNAQFATHLVLTISLNIAYDYKEVSKFLSQALPTTISLLTALRRTMVIPPPSVTSLTNHTSTEEGSDEGSTVTTLVCITDNREPFIITMSNREERCFILVRYINDTIVFEAGTSNINRG
uniref:Uncharacterized protein n=1 Tax=Moniliophthora roreri TaxID=221103 RepID=A0A0W0FQX2_MONRR